VTAVAEPSLRTEYPFTLPRGYVDESGAVHRSGVLRLATARDELTAHNEPMVRQNAAYLSVFLIMRTVVRLGALAEVDRFVVEHLFASDLAFLQDLYRRINQDGHTEVAVACPNCGEEFAVDIAGDAPGGS
jgi:hypothetical protein